MSRADDAIKDAQFGDGAEWSAITGKPTEFPPEAHTHPLSNLDSTGATAGQVARFDGSNVVWGTVQWSNVGSKPTEFAPSAHNHAVSDLSQSGATTGQLLQWNGTAWVPATIATGGKEVITVIKTARQTVTSSTTFVADNHLTATLKADKTYFFEMELFVSAPASGGFKYSLNTTSFSSGKGFSVNSVLSSQIVGGAGNITQNSSNAFTITSVGTSVRIAGRIAVGASDTNLLLQWAQNTSNATGTFVEELSYMKFTEV